MKNFLLGLVIILCTVKCVGCRFASIPETLDSLLKCLHPQTFYLDCHLEVTEDGACGPEFKHFVLRSRWGRD